MFAEPVVISLDGTPKFKLKTSSGSVLTWEKVAEALRKQGLIKPTETLKGFVVSEKEFQVKTEGKIFQV